MDVCYEISDYQTITDNGICFTIVSPVLEDNSLRVDVIAEYSIDDDLGEDSTCTIACKDGAGRTICSGNIYFFIMEMDMKGRSALWKPVRILNMTLLR